MRDRLRARLAGRVPEKLHIPGFQEAAVLVPLVRRSTSHTLVFTARPSDLPTHGGQISMPGGKRAAGDREPIDTALRETAEELGLGSASVEVLGLLDDAATPLGFVITPVVGWLDDPPAFTPDAREVEDVLELDLDTLRHPGAYRDAGERVVGARSYRLHEYHVAGRVIWGATARIVHQLLELVGPAN